LKNTVFHETLKYYINATLYNKISFVNINVLTKMNYLLALVNKNTAVHFITSQCINVNNYNFWF